MTSPEEPAPGPDLSTEAPFDPPSTEPSDEPAVPVAAGDATTTDTATTTATADAATTDAATKQPKAPRPQRSFWRELPFLIVIALVLALLIKTFLVQAFYIPSASMEPTLEGGPATYGGPPLPYDRVLVNKLVYRFRDPHRGEIVVFKRPYYWTADAIVPQSTGFVHWLNDLESDVGIPVSSTEDIIKRVIGLPGDVVNCSKNDVLTVNGHTLNEPYVYPGNSECLINGVTPFHVKVAPGHLFVMGDHRDDSADSRLNMTGNPWQGAIPISNVVGRAFLVIWPHQDWKVLHVPSTFKQQGLAAAGANPALAGLVGAVPLTLARRRWKRRRRAVRR